MNDILELKNFALVHARAQQIPDAQVARVLSRVEHDGEGARSWTGEWSRAASHAVSNGDLPAATRLYTMARFPFVDGPERAAALRLAQSSFADWLKADNVPLRRLHVPLHGGRADCWSSGTPTKGQPFVVLMGGIVSTKEQWAPTLLRMRRFGIRGLAAEMPGAGGNTLPYDLKSWRMLSALLDAAGVPDDGSVPVYAMAMSFSGHLALRTASADRRIKGLITVGAPVHAFFTDAAWHSRLPKVTVDTLAHLIGVKAHEVADRLPERALSPDRLAALDLPVAYVASRRDEIIPPQEIDLLRRHVSRLSLLEHDDVHASPAHTSVTGPWLVLSLLRMHGGRTFQRAALRGSLVPLRAAAFSRTALSMSKGR